MLEAGLEMGRYGGGNHGLISLARGGMAPGDQLISTLQVCNALVVKSSSSHAQTRQEATTLRRLGEQIVDDAQPLIPSTMATYGPPLPMALVEQARMLAVRLGPEAVPMWVETSSDLTAPL